MKKGVLPSPSLELSPDEERAACPRCGRLLLFPAGSETIACPVCRADWRRPVASARPLAFAAGGRHFQLGPRWIGAQHRPRYPFQHALHAEPEVRALAAKFGVRRCLRGTTLWDRQRDLLRVLRIERFPARPPRALLRRLGLDPITRTNTHWFCSHFAYLYALFAASLGWTARILNVGPDSPPKPLGHMIAEIWNDDFQKWIVVDPLYAAWFSRRERPGTPLSFLEVRAESFRRGGREILLHHRVRASKENEFGPERAIPAVESTAFSRFLHPAVYFWGIAYLSNRFLTEPYEEGRFLALLWRDEKNSGRPWINGTQPVGYYRARQVVETQTERDFHPPLNNTALWLLRDGGAPRVFLRTHCPNFARFERKTGGAWRRAAAEFPLAPRPGRFLWEFRAVNRFGVAGKPARIQGVIR